MSPHLLLSKGQCALTNMSLTFYNASQIFTNKELGHLINWEGLILFHLTANLLFPICHSNNCFGCEWRQTIQTNIFFPVKSDKDFVEMETTQATNICLFSQNG